MKKGLLIIILFVLGNAHLVEAQCYGTVNFDVGVTAGAVNNFGNTTFSITTAYCHELIMISYNGWNGPGSGPVTVNGNPATFIKSATNGNSGSADVYGYQAGAAGTYTIVCSPNGYNGGYYTNFAAAFYATGTSNPLTIASLTNITLNTIACTTGGSISDNITTTIPGSMIYCSTEINEGQPTPYPISYAGATFLGNTHTEDGIDAAHAYEPAPTIGTYTVTATNSSPPNNGCGGLVLILVDIPPPPCGGGNMSAIVNTIQPSCKGNDGSIGLVVSGGLPPYTYIWFPNVSSSANATGLSAGLYAVTVNSANDSCASYSDTIRLVGPSVVITSTQTKCSPSNTGTAIINIINGSPAFTYSWSNGQTNQTATGLTAGKYVVTVVDSKGCKFKDSINVATYSAPSVVTVPSAGDTICYNSSAVITATGANSYTWLPARGLNCYNCASPTASPNVTTVYTVTGTDSNGCTNTVRVTVNIVPLPKPIITGVDTICIGSSIILNVIGANTYVWNPGGQIGSSDTVRPPATIVYTVVATTGSCSNDTTFKLTVVPIPSAKINLSKDSICLRDSLTMTASGGTTYRWSPGNSTSSKVHINNLLNTTTYTLYAYGGTCVDSTTATIYLIPPVLGVVSISKDSICPHGSTMITAHGSGGGHITYRWSNGATNSSITVSDTVSKAYIVTIYGTCDSAQYVVPLTVVPLPEPVISGSTWKCKGVRDTLRVTSITNPTKYVWSNGKTTTSIITGIINADSVIYVTAYNSLGCSKRDTFHITEIPYPIVSLKYPPGCGDNVTTITARILDSVGQYTYNWSTGGTDDTINVTIKDTTAYTVIISNGCKITGKISVIQDVPDLSACCNATIFVGGNSIITAGGKNIKRYYWQPDDGLNCDTCAGVVASPTVTTTYTITGTDVNGCQTERVVTITVDIPCFDFVVPNVFTPTQPGLSGLDNKFYIQTKNITGWSISIYDRWGKEVYKSTNQNEYWDGSNEGGGKALEGVYYYEIDGTCQNTTYKKDGFVQLIR